VGHGGRAKKNKKTGVSGSGSEADGTQKTDTIIVAEGVFLAHCTKKAEE
jgi:hypothetical protein